MRLLTERVLAKNGYQVTTACEAAEALTLLGSLSQPPALLLSDIVMPGMNGVELAQAAQEMYPGLKVLLISGYAGDALISRVQEAQRYTILPKPFNPASLTQAIRQALELSLAASTSAGDSHGSA